MSAPVECGTYGRASSDGNTRLYTQAECNTLGGNFSANGECMKKTGGSFSWDCRNLNKQTSPSATCLAGDASSVAFQQYIKSCRNNINKNDDAIANNFLSEAIDKYKNIFDSYRAQYTDLMIATENVQSTTQNVSSLSEQLNNLQKQKQKLIEEIKHYKMEAGAADRMFLEDAYNGTPKEKTAPTLQDFALLLFWFSWLVMSVVLIAIRCMSPGGWQAGLFVFVILLLVTLCVFAIINYAA
jgi:hypothetical protein